MATDFVNDDIYVMNSDGTDCKPLAPSTRKEEQKINALSWSPDGKELAYELATRNATTGAWHSDIFAVEASGGSDPIRVTQTATENEAEPAWSPSSGEIVFVRGPAGDGNCRLFAIRLDDGVERQLTDEPAAFPAWSPDSSENHLSRRRHQSRQRRSLHHRRGRQRRARKADRYSGYHRAGVGVVGAAARLARHAAGSLVVMESTPSAASRRWVAASSMVHGLMA